MFKSISKYNLGIVAKNTVLAVAIILGLSLSAKAEETETYKTLKVSCNPFSTFDDRQCQSDLAAKPEANKIAQNRRRRGRVRDRNRKIDGFYTGFGLGIGFPDGGVGLTNVDNTDFPDAEYNNSFIGSLFGGLKFSDNFSADAEFLLGVGGLDTDELDEFTNEPGDFAITGEFESDGDYSAFAFYLNPRFELPLSDSFSIYISPGIGISQTIVTFNAKDDTTDFFDNEDFSNTSFTYQIKGGASYSITNTIEVFGQVRYASLGTDDVEEGDEFAFPDDINIFSTEVGLKFNLL